MKYEISKPAIVRPNKKNPAIFVMHGMGSNELDMLPLVKELEDKFFIFSVRGHISQPPGYAYFTIKKFGVPNRSVFDEAINRLSNFIDYAADNYPIDPDQFYLIGFSQGAIVSMTLGLTINRPIKGVAAFSGYIPGFVKKEYPLKSVKELAIFISHGEQDNILPYKWGLENNKLFQELKAQVTFRSYSEGHAISLENQRDFIDWILGDYQN